MMKMKKAAVKLALCGIALGSTILPVFAAREEVGGGTWTYGVDDTMVFSYYQHNKKVHSSRVIGFVEVSSGWKNPKIEAIAESRKSYIGGNQAFWNVKD